MKKSTKISLTSIAAVLVLVMALSVVLVACSNNTPEVAKAESFVTVDINPSIELVLDQNNVVMSATAGNADAEVLLYNADGIVGAKVDVAVQRLATLAVELKYTKESNNVSVTVSGKTDASANSIYNTVKTSLESVITNCSVEHAIDIVLEKEVAALKLQYASNANVQALTVDRYRLIRSAMFAKADLTFEQAVQLSNAELADIVKNQKQALKAKVNNASLIAVQNAQKSYEIAKQIALDSAYLSLYAQADVAALSRLNTLPLEYVAWHTAELSMKQAYQLSKDTWLDRELTNEQANQIAIALFDTKTEQDAFLAGAKNENDKYTKQSVLQYVNKYYRNLAEVERQAFMDKYGTVMNTISDLNFEANVDINSDFGSIKAQINLSGLGAIVTSTFQTCANVVLNTLGITKDITYSTFEEKIAYVETQTATIKAELINAMTSEEKQYVAELQSNIGTKIQTAENNYNQALNQAKTEAKNWLQNQQNQRRQQGGKA